MTTKKEFLVDMAKLEEINNKYDAQVKLLCDYGFSNEAPIFDAADRAIMFAADMLADKYSIHRDAMPWHIWENKFGEKKMGCRLKGQKKTHKIKNASDFWVFEMKTK